MNEWIISIKKIYIQLTSDKTSYKNHCLELLLIDVIIVDRRWGEISRIFVRSGLIFFFCEDFCVLQSYSEYRTLSRTPSSMTVILFELRLRFKIMRRFSFLKVSGLCLIKLRFRIKLRLRA